MGLRESLAESDRPTGTFENAVFRPDVPIKYQDSEGAVRFCILPAIKVNNDDTIDKSQFLAYRDSEDFFTEWARVYKVHRTVGRVLEITDPRLYLGPEAVDPIELLWNTARSDSRFFDVISKDPHTKKLREDAYKTAHVRPPEWRVIFNAIDPGAEDRERVYIQVVSKSAVFPKKYVMLPEREGAAPSAPWTLAEALDQMNRNVSPETPQSDFDARFYWGDITNPHEEGDHGGMAVVSVRKETPPTGGIDMYRVRVLDVPPVPGTQAMLQGRFDFHSEVFIEWPMDEYLDKVCNALRGKAEALMWVAWADEGPEFQAALERNNIGRDSAPVTPGATLAQHREEGDDLDMSPAPVPPASVPAASIPPVSESTGEPPNADQAAAPEEGGQQSADRRRRIDEALRLSDDE